MRRHITNYNHRHQSRIYTECYVRPQSTYSVVSPCPGVSDVTSKNRANSVPTCATKHRVRQNRAGPRTAQLSINSGLAAPSRTCKRRHQLRSPVRFLPHTTFCRTCRHPLIVLGRHSSVINWSEIPVYCIAHLSPALKVKTFVDVQ